MPLCVVPAWSATATGKGAVKAHLLSVGLYSSTVLVRLPSRVPPATAMMWSDSTPAWKRVLFSNIPATCSHEPLRGSNLKTFTQQIILDLFCSCSAIKLHSYIHCITTRKGYCRDSGPMQFHLQITSMFVLSKWFFKKKKGKVLKCN